ncbi:MAG: 3-hydroxyacyl-CoA dehydrogenase NAD-binding domain-containing protein [Gammaproteobacteria bacterium]
MTAIRKVGVVGAGVMGAGIAAHITNAGVPVLLLDIVAEGAGDRSALAAEALARLRRADPPAFMTPSNAELITAGNTEDHLERLAECDWIIEAVVERLEVKRVLYGKIHAVRKPGSIVSSNTSTLPLALLTGGLPQAFSRDFLITHFFNPPRYLRLLELVTGPQTGAKPAAMIREFADVALGKAVIDCHDTPGFIANRIGIFWLQCAVTEAIDGGLTVEEADAVLSRPVGIPKTGVFGLLDLVGLDLMPETLASMAKALPQSDHFHSILREPELVRRMIAEGYTGRKGKGGFYRLNTSSGKRVKEAIDLHAGSYRPTAEPRLESLSAARAGGLRALLEHTDKGGRYAWRVLSRTLSYAASLVPEIADDVVAIDSAMRLGYHWKHGPFELIDQLGPSWLAQRLAAEGQAVPVLLQAAAKADGQGFYRVRDGHLQYLGTDHSYHRVKRPTGVALLADLKRCSQPLLSNASASLWDVGDGIACFEFHTKMNAIDPGVLELLEQTLRVVPERGDRALIIYNEGRHFSVGANLGLALFAANIAAWSDIDAIVRRGQAVYQALKYAPFPVVGAPAGIALGGGCEILLHCDAIQAHAESYLGLVEVGVGLVPAWGGCTELLRRWMADEHRPRGPMPPVAKAFEIISLASVAKSAAEAKALLFLRNGDGITMNRDRLLADAKAKALELARGYRPPPRPEFTLPGESGRIALDLALDNFHRLGKATPHDVVVCRQLAQVLTGGETDMTETVSEEALRALERESFSQLVRHPATLARIEHMLATGKPLRN